MPNKNWNETIKYNFNNAASKYLNFSVIQRFFALKIVSFLKDLNIPEGEWIDLGSGTGLLADEIENIFSKKKVCRLDFSQKMLSQNKPSSKKLLWDLNNGLPPAIDNYSLIVSNFCIHWLNNPSEILRKWFNKLKSGGYLIISCPTNKCFPEWKDTCRKINSEYSGLDFPDAEEFERLFKSNEIYFKNKYSYVDNFPDVYKLLKNIVNVGAQSSKKDRKTVFELKQMQKFWPKNPNQSVNLSWEIYILIIKKL